MLSYFSSPSTAQWLIPSLADELSVCKEDPTPQIRMHRGNVAYRMQDANETHADGPKQQEWGQNASKKCLLCSLLGPCQQGYGCMNTYMCMFSCCCALAAISAAILLAQHMPDLCP
mmetsp:Transcript_60770/g.100353  ORF Transcript_60770/g.100353 Transcript_60770/m.100353 type:complete len:116 (+) Transcript_60770:6440-6787(+)